MSEWQQSAETDAVVDAARALLRTATRPASGSATAQVNAAALDRLRLALRAVDEPSTTPACTCHENAAPFGPCALHNPSTRPDSGSAS